jgi:hypothetical protein
MPEVRLTVVWRALVASAVVVVLAFATANQPVAAETIDRVLAVVAGQVILLTDVNAARELGLQTAQGSDPVRAVLSKLIDRQLMLVEVDRYSPPEPTAASIEQAAAEVRARFATAEAFESELAHYGIDEQHLRETLRQDLRIRAYLEQRFPPADVRRESLIEEWVASLRRRGDVVDLYVNSPL